MSDKRTYLAYLSMPPFNTTMKITPDEFNFGTHLNVPLALLVDTNDAPADELTLSPVLEFQRTGKLNPTTGFYQLKKVHV